MADLKISQLTAVTSVVAPIANSFIAAGNLGV